MNKTALFIVTGIFAVIAIGFFAATRSRTVAPRAPTAFVTPPPVHPSAMPQPIESAPITYTGTPNLTFPKQLPFFEITRHRTFDTERARLVSLFNASEKAGLIEGSRGKYLSFGWADKTAILSEKPLTLSYTINKQAIRFVTNDINKYRKTVSDALAEYSMLPQQYSLSLQKQTYFSFEGPHPTERTGPEQAQMIQLDFSMTVDSIPVFIGDVDTPVFSVSFNGDDEIAVFRGFFLPDIKKADSPVSIIPYDEALSRLKANKGVLSSVSLSSRGENEFMTGGVPTSIEVETASLGYLYTEAQTYLIPVYVFTGRAREPGSSAVLRTTTVVAAI